MLDGVREVFTRLARHSKEDGRFGVVKTIRMPESLYRKFLNIHDHARILVDSVQAILNDGEHQTIIEEGILLKYRMPDMAGFSIKIAAVRAQLDSYDPNNHIREGKDVVLPAYVARGLYVTALTGTAFVHDCFEAVTKTDYWKYMRVLKENGVPYAGPVVLPQMYALHLSLQIAAVFTQREAIPEQLPRNWTRDPRLTNA